MQEFRSAAEKCKYIKILGERKTFRESQREPESATESQREPERAR